MITLAIDAMGGDHGVTSTIPAALAALKSHDDLSLVLVGRPEVLRPALARTGTHESERLRIYAATEVVGMDESPAITLRTKKDSSMRVAINLVRESAAQAAVSAGNTGALMATARFVLKTLPGIDRPAIISTWPTRRGHVHILDLGANVDCTAEQLLQFAIMGSLLVGAIEGKPAPKVCLLNVGVEDIKGNQVVKHAAELIRATTLNFGGYIEGDEIYLGDADVIVCDGFVGNITMKASEGLAKMIGGFLKETFERNLLSRVAGLVALPVLRNLRDRMDPRRYNGASLVGLTGIVVKSHGSADAYAFGRAIDVARAEVHKHVPELIGRRLAELSQCRTPA